MSAKRAPQSPRLRSGCATAGIAACSSGDNGEVRERVMRMARAAGAGAAD